MGDDVQDSEEVVRADDVGRRKARHGLRHILALGLVGLLVLVAVLNFDQVKVDLLFGSEQLPLIVVIAVSVAAGFALGWIFSRRREKRRRD